MKSGAALKEGPPCYQLTVDWLTPNIEVWDHVLNHVKPTKFLEVGCYEGRATTFLIERCGHRGPLSLTCVDTWAGAIDLPPEKMAGVEARFDHNIALACSQNNATVTKVKAKSSQALPKLIADGALFDFIYIDGSHTAPDVLADAIDAFRLLRVGGAMIFDDYVWCMEAHGREDPLNMPKPAIDAFVNIYARKMQIAHISAQFSLIKTHD